MKYSICITHYNDRETLKGALDSLLPQLDSSYEVVISDNMSDDGSEIVLDEYARSGAIKLVRGKWSRGLGRQAAMVNSAGEHIIAQLDMDDVFNPILPELVGIYHSTSEGRILAVVSRPGDWTTNITIGPRSLISELGGWRNLHYGEDWDLWSRAAKLGKYSWTIFPIVARSGRHVERSWGMGLFRFRVRKYTDELRLGRRVFEVGETVSVAQRGAFFVARLSAPFQGAYHDKFNRDFSCSDPKYFVPLKSEVQRRAEAV
ncbi:MAG: glycosyltransferase [Thaumarchaeota archaeon]|nr:glycosyltransferase [Nitrososphaerota archaeon]